MTEQTIIRCANWEQDRAICGENCGLTHVGLTTTEARVRAMQAGWIYLDYLARNGVRQQLPFCALRCLVAWGSRREADHAVGVVHGASEGQGNG